MSDTGQPTQDVRGTAPFRRHAAELDLFAGMHPMRVGRIAWILALATLIAAMLNSRSITNWAVELPFELGMVRDWIILASQTWHGWMMALGLDQVHTAVRDAFRWLQFWQPGGP